MERHLDLLSLEEIVQDRLVTEAMEPNQISEIKREEDFLERRDLRVGFYFLSDPFDHGEVSL